MSSAEPDACRIPPVSSWSGYIHRCASRGQTVKRCIHLLALVTALATIQFSGGQASLSRGDAILYVGSQRSGNGWTIDALAFKKGKLSYTRRSGALPKDFEPRSMDVDSSCETLCLLAGERPGLQPDTKLLIFRADKFGALRLTQSLRVPADSMQVVLEPSGRHIAVITLASSKRNKTEIVTWKLARGKASSPRRRSYPNPMSLFADYLQVFGAPERRDRIFVVDSWNFTDSGYQSISLFEWREGNLVKRAESARNWEGFSPIINETGDKLLVTTDSGLTLHQLEVKGHELRPSGVLGPPEHKVPQPQFWTGVALDRGYLCQDGNSGDVYLADFDSPGRPSIRRLARLPRGYMSFDRRERILYVVGTKEITTYAVRKNRGETSFTQVATVPQKEGPFVIWMRS